MAINFEQVHSRRDVLRRLAALGAVGVGAPLLGACGSPSTPENLAFSSDLGGASLIALLRGSFTDGFDQLAINLSSEWQAARNATIELTLSQDWRTEGPQIARERGGADISQLAANQPHILSELLLDVSELAETVGDSLGQWSDVARQTCVVDGVWRAVPWSTTRHVLVARTDILNAIGAGLPQTYDDLLNIATMLVDEQLPPIGITMAEEGPADSGAIAYGLLWSFGGQEVSMDGRVALDSSETRQALEYFRELSEVNTRAALNWTHPDNNAAYLAGEIAITQNPTSIFLTALDEEPEIAEATGHIPLPAGPAGQFHLPEIDSLGIFQHTAEPAAARDWIEFVTQGPVLVDRARESLGFFAPLVLGLEDDPEMPWNTNPRLTGLASNAAEGRAQGWPLPPSIEAGLVYQNASIVKMFSAVGSGEATIDEAISVTTDSLRRVYET